MTGILGSLDPTQFWILVLTLWTGIVGMIGCTIWAVTRIELSVNKPDRWNKSLCKAIWDLDSTVSNLENDVHNFCLRMVGRK